MTAYSPERRTALILCGTGAHGAYHAGVLRALQEAGVKIDLVAGQGIGAAGAALTAIGGGGRLWEDNGLWRSPAIRTLYRWKSSAIAAPIAILTCRVLLFGTAIAAAAGWVSPPWWVALIAGAFGIAIGGCLVLAQREADTTRRATGRWWWRMFGAPIDTAGARELFATATWDLIRGATPVSRPASDVLGRRYSEVLLESLGQPGFAELIVVATDLDARRDVVAALLREPYRSEFVASRPGRDRPSEVLDLTGVGRDYVIDVVAGALTPPVIADPALVHFAPDSFWRGETHRLCDRVASVNRLFEEVAAAGASQAILVSAVAPASGPHMLRVPRLDPRSRLGEVLAAAEAAALRDALEMARLRFDSVYSISPAHNPVGPFDVAGAYDGASDRRQDLLELMAHAYEDAYHQFIEPVVGASGEQLARPAPTADDMRPGGGPNRIFGA